MQTPLDMVTYQPYEPYTCACMSVLSVYVQAQSKVAGLITGTQSFLIERERKKGMTLDSDRNPMLK